MEDDIADSLPQARERLERWPSTTTIFFNGDRPLQEGDRLIQLDLADTLASHREGWPARFLSGPHRRADRRRRARGRRHHDQGRSAKLSPGRARGRARHAIAATTSSPMPPPSSGGVHLIEMLNILEGYDLASSPARKSLHDMIEAMKRAYADRAVFMGDPDAVKIPVAGLISKAYANRCARPDRRARDAVSRHPRRQACRFRRPQHDAFFGDRSRRQCRIEHLHVEFFLWPWPRCRRNRRAAQQ